MVDPTTSTSTSTSTAAILHWYSTSTNNTGTVLRQCKVVNCNTAAIMLVLVLNGYWQYWYSTILLAGSSLAAEVA